MGVKIFNKILSKREILENYNNLEYFNEQDLVCIPNLNCDKWLSIINSYFICFKFLNKYASFIKIFTNSCSVIEYFILSKAN